MICKINLTGYLFSQPVCMMQLHHSGVASVQQFNNE